MEIYITLLNLGYAIVGAGITLVFIVIGYKMFDKMTPFDTSRQLARGWRRFTSAHLSVAAILCQVW